MQRDEQAGAVGVGRVELDVEPDAVLGGGGELTGGGDDLRDRPFPETGDARGRSRPRVERVQDVQHGAEPGALQRPQADPLAGDLPQPGQRHGRQVAPDHLTAQCHEPLFDLPADPRPARLDGAGGGVQGRGLDADAAGAGGPGRRTPARVARPAGTTRPTASTTGSGWSRCRSASMSASRRFNRYSSASARCRAVAALMRPSREGRSRDVRSGEAGVTASPVARVVPLRPAGPGSSARQACHFSISAPNRSATSRPARSAGACTRARTSSR